MATKKPNTDSRIAENKKAIFNYFIEERFEALECFRDHVLVGRQSHELFGELLETNFAGGISKVVDFDGLRLVE